MDYLILILEILALLGILFLAMLKKNYFPKYLEEKAKNVAMQEDIQKITSQIEDVKQEYKIQFDEIQKKNDVFFDEIKQTKNRFNSKQFELYNELWSSLIDLKISADYLWKSATARNLIKFSSNLDSAKVSIEKKSLLIENTHYKKLMTIIEKLEAYEEGKIKLVEIRNKTTEEVEGLAYQSYIQGLIHSNESLKLHYEALLNTLKEKFKNTIRGESINKTLESNS